MNFESPVLTQQQLQDLLQTLAGWPSPFSSFSSWEEAEDYKKQWVESAPDSWFSSLLEACVFYNKEGDEEQRNNERFELVSLLSLWLRNHPKDWRNFSSLLKKADTRSIALSVWASEGYWADKEIRESFIAFVDDLNYLSESEIVDLIDGLMDETLNSLPVLKRIEAFVPETMPEAKAELEIYKKNLGIESF